MHSYLLRCALRRTKSSCGTSSKVRMCGALISTICHPPFVIHNLMITGMLLQDTPITRPNAAIFFNRDSNKLIVACKDGIFVVEVSTHSKLPFSGTPKAAYYWPHALALSNDDSVLVASDSNIVYGYDTASRTRLWLHIAASSVCAVCKLGANVLVTVFENPTLVLDFNTGAHIAALKKSDGPIYGLGVVEGLCFIPSLFTHCLRSPHLRVPRHAPASPPQAGQGFASAVGDVGLDCEVPRVAVIGCCDGKPIISLRQSQTQSHWTKASILMLCKHLCKHLCKCSTAENMH